MRIVVFVFTLHQMLPLQLAGQSGGVGATLIGVQLSRTTGTIRERPNGLGVGVEGWIASSYFGLTLRYYQGLVSSAAQDSDQEIVEGEAMAWFRPARGVGLGLGPHIRSLVTANGTERWLFLEARLHTEARLVGPIIGFADGWRVLAANVNVGERFNNGYGIEGGLTVRFNTLPLALTARYRSERAKLAGGERIETVEQIAFVAGFAWF